ncbi:hypothetical protein IMG5_061270 [Ichthyophthirius multifiliis]|uniref:DUF4200 domain-containing protein n=1 Tax=Ichthyophthirius multifiliis TaxID=5932 RepID=G0QNT7_ICHMU|nr:hypothetical protein IMG5_061270 [Ichthyophthirius multifiliis]EGR33128.1 hypothetical protein IMG5_061270 [Ichthyophthirius multifiliis]|eukprot:XP_004037114.1 hypothetical protein IMG5_061270 [Ichthyophthirius multifiliis]
MTIEERLYSKTKISKKFGIIRALDEEAEKMAKAREETLARDQKREEEQKKHKKIPIWCVFFFQVFQFFQNIRSSTDSDLNKQMSRINNLLKEKRETIAEFVQKKREIYLSNMNINNKKEETNKLEDYIKNEKESLKARKYYFENDWTMVNKFIKEVENEANEAQKEAEKQQKEREKNKEKINQFIAEVERCEQKISRKQEEYQTLLTYKQFIDGIIEKYQEIYVNSNQQQQEQYEEKKDNIYLTQNENNSCNNIQQTPQVKKIPLNPSQLNDILNHIQEKNLYYCQNNNENEEDYEQKKHQNYNKKLNYQKIKKNIRKDQMNLKNKKKQNQEENNIWKIRRNQTQVRYRFQKEKTLIWKKQAKKYIKLQKLQKNMMQSLIKMKENKQELLMIYLMLYVVLIQIQKNQKIDALRNRNYYLILRNRQKKKKAIINKQKLRRKNLRFKFKNKRKRNKSKKQKKRKINYEQVYHLEIIKNQN